MFTGTYTAIVTPFKNGQVDEAAFRNLIQFQIDNGVNGIVPSRNYRRGCYARF